MIIKVIIYFFFGFIHVCMWEGLIRVYKRKSINLVAIKKVPSFLGKTLVENFSSLLFSSTFDP